MEEIKNVFVRIQELLINGALSADDIQAALEEPQEKVEWALTEMEKAEPPLVKRMIVEGVEVWSLVLLASRGGMTLAMKPPTPLSIKERLAARREMKAAAPEVAPDPYGAEIPDHWDDAKKGRAMEWLKQVELRQKLKDESKSPRMGQKR